MSIGRWNDATRPERKLPVLAGAEIIDPHRSADAAGEKKAAVVRQRKHHQRAGEIAHDPTLTGARIPDLHRTIGLSLRESSPPRSALMAT